ncbi:MAG: hypothetical protein NTY15_03660 [Planctomycetota bacterium]|nr:hypothetical protein [Planctomycetota bacterium]
MRWQFIAWGEVRFANETPGNAAGIDHHWPSDPSGNVVALRLSSHLFIAHHGLHPWLFNCHCSAVQSN